MSAENEASQQGEPIQPGNTPPDASSESPETPRRDSFDVDALIDQERSTTEGQPALRRTSGVFSPNETKNNNELEKQEFLSFFSGFTEDSLAGADEATLQNYQTQLGRALTWDMAHTDANFHNEVVTWSKWLDSAKKRKESAPQKAPDLNASEIRNLKDTAILDAMREALGGQLVSEVTDPKKLEKVEMAIRRAARGGHDVDMVEGFLRQIDTRRKELRTQPASSAEVTAPMAPEATENIQPESTATASSQETNSAAEAEASRQGRAKKITELKAELTELSQKDLKNDETSASKYRKKVGEARMWIQQKLNTTEPRLDVEEFGEWLSSLVTIVGPAATEGRTTEPPSEIKEIKSQEPKRDAAFDLNKSLDGLDAEDLQAHLEELDKHFRKAQETGDLALGAQIHEKSNRTAEALRSLDAKSGVNEEPAKWRKAARRAESTVDSVIDLAKERARRGLTASAEVGRKGGEKIRGAGKWFAEIMPNWLKRKKKSQERAEKGHEEQTEHEKDQALEVVADATAPEGATPEQKTEVKKTLGEKWEAFKGKKIFGMTVADFLVGATSGAVGGMVLRKVIKATILGASTTGSLATFGIGAAGGAASAALSTYVREKRRATAEFEKEAEKLGLELGELKGYARLLRVLGERKIGKDNARFQEIKELQAKYKVDRKKIWKAAAVGAVMGGVFATVMQNAGEAFRYYSGNRSADILPAGDQPLDEATKAQIRGSAENKVAGTKVDEILKNKPKFKYGYLGERSEPSLDNMRSPDLPVDAPETAPVKPGEEVARGLETKPDTAGQAAEGVIEKGSWISKTIDKMVAEGKISANDASLARNNPLSGATIDGKFINIDKIGLVHEGDVVKFVPGENGTAGRFEIIQGPKPSVGTDQELYNEFKKSGKPAPEWLEKRINPETQAPEVTNTTPDTPIRQAGTPVTGSARPGWHADWAMREAIAKGVADAAPQGEVYGPPVPEDELAPETESETSRLDTASARGGAPEAEIKYSSLDGTVSLRGPISFEYGSNGEVVGIDPHEATLKGIRGTEYFSKEAGTLDSMRTSSLSMSGKTLAKNILIYEQIKDNPAFSNESKWLLNYLKKSVELMQKEARTVELFDKSKLPDYLKK